MPHHLRNRLNLLTKKAATDLTMSARSLVIKPPVRITLAILAGMWLTACSSFFSPSGYDQFECDRSKGNVSDKCKGVVGVLQSTNGKIPTTDYDSQFSMEQFYRDQGLISDKTSKNEQAAMVASNLPHTLLAKREVMVDGAPVRIAPVVIKIVINEYVTDKDVLVRRHEVFKEVMPSRWNGHKAAAESKAENDDFFPHFAAPAASGANANQVGVSDSDGAYGQRNVEIQNVGQAMSAPDINSLANQKPQ